MRKVKRCISCVLIVLLIFGGFTVSSASASEIWPGYPGPDELPAINTIPDPLKFFDVKNDPNGDGYVSSPEEWDARREEIKDLVQRYWLGYRWPTRPEDVSGETRTVMEPNVISIWFGPTFNIREEFDKLVIKLLHETVEIREIIPPASFWEPPKLGDVIYTFGPAENEAEATDLAIQAWNAGYYVSYDSWFGTNYCVFRDYTGKINSPPPEENLLFIIP